MRSEEGRSVIIAETVPGESPIEGANVEGYTGVISIVSPGPVAIHASHELARRCRDGTLAVFGKLHVPRDANISGPPRYKLGEYHAIMTDAPKRAEQEG